MKKNDKAAPAVNTFDAATSLAAINSNIAWLRKNSTAFQNKVQETLVLISRHALATGDCSAMARLMNDGLSGWVRRGPICDYVADFGPIRISFKGGVATAKFCEKDENGNRPPFDIDGMIAKPFWEHKSMQKDVELPLEIDDLDTKVEKLAKSVATLLKDGKIAESARAHAERLVAGLRTTVHSVRAADRSGPSTPAPADPVPVEAPAAVMAGAASA